MPSWYVCWLLGGRVTVGGGNVGAYPHDAGNDGGNVDVSVGTWADCPHGAENGGSHVDVVGVDDGITETEDAVPPGIHDDDCHERGIPYGGSGSGRGFGCVCCELDSPASNLAFNFRNNDITASVDSGCSTADVGISAD